MCIRDSLEAARRCARRVFRLRADGHRALRDQREELDRRVVAVQVLSLIHI